MRTTQSGTLSALSPDQRRGVREQSSKPVGMSIALVYPTKEVNRGYYAADSDASDLR